MDRITISDVIDIIIEFTLKISNKKQAIQFIVKEQKKHVKICQLLIFKFGIKKNEIVNVVRKNWDL